VSFIAFCSPSCAEVETGHRSHWPDRPRPGALRRLQRESLMSSFVFVSERGFARMIERAAAFAGLELKAHPHMLRHAGGSPELSGRLGDEVDQAAW
jgi:hypothetical protein